MTDGEACLEAALAYLRLGWCPIPLCPPDHVGMGREHCDKCTSPGKAPLIAGWTSFATLPAEGELRIWWTHWPNANVGIVMGKISGGLVGTDSDGPAGEKAIAELFGQSVETLAFRTPAGGLRRLFLVPPSVGLRIRYDKLGEKQEFRLLGEGSQTVAPPSRHANGGRYEWVDNGLHQP